MFSLNSAVVCFQFKDTHTMCASLFAALAYNQANFWVYRDEQAWISWNSFIIAPMYYFGHNLAWYAWSLRTWPMAYCTIFNVYLIVYIYMYLFIFIYVYIYMYVYIYIYMLWVLMWNLGLVLSSMASFYILYKGYLSI